MVKKVKIIMRFCNLKKISDLNFVPIFKNLVSKCLAGYLYLKRNTKKNKKYLRFQNEPKNYKNG